MRSVLILCFVGLVLAQSSPRQQPNNEQNRTKLSVTADNYIQHKDPQNEFDWKLIKTLFKESGSENVIVSPLSVKILLTLLAEAAGQVGPFETRQELRQVLPFNKNLTEAREYYGNICKSLKVENKAYKVNMGTSVFLDNFIAVNQKFESIATYNYDAMVKGLNFSASRDAADEINAWVSKVTEGRISELVTEDGVAQSVILMLNAIYFEGTWRYGFNDTSTRDFYLQPTKTVSKEFVTQTGKFYYYYSRSLNAKMLRLPYNGQRFSMFIILPNDVGGIDELVERLEEKNITDQVWHMDTIKVQVALPKFKIDSTINMNNIVKKLGIREIFTTNATFPVLARGGASEGKLMVSNIVQKSGIVVDEKGTIAYAATKIELINKIGGDPREFIADRPFVFYIEDETTGAILFAGLLANKPGQQPANDPHDGIFKIPANGEDQTPLPETDHDYIQHKDKQDEFDWKLTKMLLKESGSKNVIVSPLSVKLLLTLLAEAAGQNVASTTRKELEQVLPFNKSLYDAKDYFGNVLGSLKVESKVYKVNMGTSIFIDNYIAVNQRFEAIATHNYDATIKNLNFGASKDSAAEINAWVSKVTEGRISELVSEDAVSQSVIMMLNAIYFEGTWRHGFNETVTRDFNLQPTKTTPKQFVTRTGNYYYFYSRKLNAKILRLPYNGRRFSMFVILPTAVGGIDELVERLEEQDINNEVWHMDEIEVQVTLPKFKFDSTINMNNIIKKLGIREIFTTNATLPLLARGGASENKLMVSNIIQKSGIVVDEKGTIAYAATEIELVNKFGGDAREFLVDRPFVFYIEDETTGAKLFAGRVNDPEY
ncbi:unnamed protein product [Diamesa hyperborea]